MINKRPIMQFIYIIHPKDWFCVNNILSKQLIQEIQNVFTLCFYLIILFTEFRTF